MDLLEGIDVISILENLHSCVLETLSESSSRKLWVCETFEIAKTVISKFFDDCENYDLEILMIAKTRISKFWWLRKNLRFRKRKSKVCDKDRISKILVFSKLWEIIENRNFEIEVFEIFKVLRKNVMISKFMTVSKTQIHYPTFRNYKISKVIQKSKYSSFFYNKENTESTKRNW